MSNTVNATPGTLRQARARRINQAGMSMLQMIVILIISAIMVMAGIFSMKYIEDAKVGNELEELVSLRGSTMLLAQQRGSNFAGVDLATVIDLNFSPRPRVIGTGTGAAVINQWKGTVTVAPATVVTASDSLAFTYTGVPSAACKQIVIPAAQIAVSVTVGTTVVKANGGVLNLATAIAQCDLTVDNATIAYTFSR